MLDQFLWGICQVFVTFLVYFIKSVLLKDTTQSLRWDLNAQPLFRTSSIIINLACADPEGFLSNTGPDPLKNHKATKPAFNVGPSSAH